MMAYALHYGYATECIDFTNAFVQADLETPVYIHLPRGFRRPDGRSDMCLRHLKSLYGLSRSQSLVRTLVESSPPPWLPSEQA